MKKNLNILMISAEMIPFAKTGGLADVVGTLPIFLKELGHDVRVVIPKYSFIDFKGHKAKLVLSSMGVWMGSIQEWARVVGTEISNHLPVYMIEHNLYFDREGLYHDSEMNDYSDNPRRFGFLTRAALQLCKDIDFKPDVVHAHDWQTALAPAYLKTWDFNDKQLGNAASLLTIHNAAYQGIYHYDYCNYLGLGNQAFTSDKFESYGHLNLLKGGIHYADLVNTVSPSYADEIKKPYGGFGLAPYLSDKGENFFGILNGVDYNVWSPKIDPLIPAKYNESDLTGKRLCKKALQNKFLLKEDPKIPVIGIIGRLTDQKGYHLLTQIIREVLNSMIVQFVILGSGETAMEIFFRELPKRFPKKVGSYIGFNNDLAHLIEAGSDFFLMPSIYEPCGLNQMYSLKYGTLPIVRATGGLNDTVVNYNEKTGEGTGFKFWDSSPDSLYYTIGWAVSTYYDRKHHMEKMIKAAMKQDFSWEKSTQEYLKAYYKAISNKKEYNSRFE